MTTYKVVLMVCLALFWAETAMVSAQCRGDFQGLVQQCARYVQKNGPTQNPSQQCCDVVKTVDFPCVCPHITADVERVVSMEKAVFVARFCGKPLAHGTRCGSKYAWDVVH
ncbi:protease inhibitor/seed storage/lipid transfer family protein [Dorcoceras hygrometricum]|uniref:Protease inhibitor/seed storage/lipid transfer family protein n=1 Tax=Dorcoceras hygrometricum TaxID=472368 RepID=A0A2Z7D5M9_9LAMI|nr:protease inhibitor/seed storage/lipid transfer family protein [Dorcoceras hygrometricum]